MKKTAYQHLLQQTYFGYGVFEKIEVNGSSGSAFKVIEANPKFEEITGFSLDPNQLIMPGTKQQGNPLWEFIHKLSVPEKHPGTLESYSLSMRKWIRHQFIAISPTEFSVFLEDITDEKEKLIDYENFSKANLDLLSTFDHSGKFTRVNSEWKNVLGYRPRELQNRSIFDFIHPEDVLSSRNAFKRLREGNVVSNFTIRFRDVHDRYLYLEWNAVISGASIYASARDISKRIKSEEDLHRTKEMLEQAGQLTKVGAWEVDLVANKINWSDVTKEIHEVGPDFNPNQKMGIDFYKKGYDRERITQLINQAIETGEGFDEELQIKTAKGNLKWIRVLAKAQFKKEKCVRLYGVFQDIHKSKSDSLELKRTKQQIDNIFEEIDDVIWSVRLPDYKLLFMTPSAERLYKIPIEEWMAEKNLWKEVIHPDNHQVVSEIIREVPEKGYYEKEYRVIDREGKIKWVLNKGKVIYGEHAEPIRLDGVISDITNSKNISLELSHLSNMQNLLLEMALKYINVPLSDIDPSLQKSLKKLGEFTKADRVYIFKYNWENQTLSNTHEWCSDNITPQIQILQNIPISFIQEWVPIHIQGREIIIKDLDQLPENSAQRAFLEEQEIKSFFTLPIMSGKSCLGFVGLDFVRAKYDYRESDKMLLSFFTQLLVNMESRNDMLHQLVEEREKAESASKSKSEFLANMSHEIRTPLNGVIGFTDLLLNTPLSPVQKQYTENANISGKSLLGIINDILDFSKIEAGKLDLEIIDIDITELVEETSDIIKYHTAQKGLEVLLDISPGMPQYAFFDPVRLRQVLVNLLSNAVKFTEKGEVTLKVGFELDHGDYGLFTFTVKDTGIGIKKDIQKKLFNAFSQADSSTTRKYGGTGLGLSISSLLVEKMGGKISLESEPDKGSAFQFTLKARFKNESVPEQNGQLPIKKVLVVDDNENNRSILNHNFNYWGISFTGVANGYEALRLIQEDLSFDLLIVDYHMPYIDGLETIQIIREKLGISAEELPIILLHSSIDDPDVREKCKRLGVKFNLIKPVKARELYGFLRNINTSEEPSVLVKANEGDPARDVNERMTILIAEDVPMNMLLVKTYLSKLLPEVTILEASNGKMAVEIFEKEQIDLILMDVQMPTVDGIQATRSIRNLEKHNGKSVPIIALTAGALEEERERCLKNGMDDFLTKPIKQEALKEAIKKHVKKNGSLPDCYQEELLGIKSFDKQHLIQTVDGDNAILRLMLTTSLGLKEQIHAMEDAIAQKDLNKLNELSLSMEEAAVTMSFSRLAMLTVKLRTYLSEENQVEIAKIGQCVTGEWESLKKVIYEEIRNIP